MASACECAPKIAPVTPTRTKYCRSDEASRPRRRAPSRDSARDVPAPVQVGTPVRRHNLYELESTPLEIPVEERAKLLSEIDEIARDVTIRAVKNVMASFVGRAQNRDGRHQRRANRRRHAAAMPPQRYGDRRGRQGPSDRAASAAAAASNGSYFFEGERWREYALRGGAPGDRESRRGRCSGR